MKTKHRIHIGNANDDVAALPSSTVDLVVTSPPYPMIEMWDSTFSEQDPAIATALETDEGWTAFQRMHAILDPIWQQVYRILVPGGIACINVGDATRTIGGAFALYPNHARILTQLLRTGFTPLPAILWRKQTNAPNKFMGSGMLPPGAYVTLEHEFVLIVRKGDKRRFLSTGSKGNRKDSSFFWEERNQWFSDVWFDLKGAGQNFIDKKIRDRSGAFPFELPYRLISMFSVKGDTVVDPFLGTGTTMLAAMATARNSIGFELHGGFVSGIGTRVGAMVSIAGIRISERLHAHAEFVRTRYETKGRFGYQNKHYSFPVVTRQETDLLLNTPTVARSTGDDEFEVEYLESPRTDDVGNWDWFFDDTKPHRIPAKRVQMRRDRLIQTDLLDSGTISENPG